MKTKQIYSLLLLWCLCCVAWAQPKVPREWQIGVIGGANLSSYNFYPSVTQDQSVGYVGGIGVRYIEEKYFGLQSELLIACRGVKERFESTPQYHFERQFTYFELPILAHVYFNIKQRSEVALDLGLKLSYYNSDKKISNLDAAYDKIIEGLERRPQHNYAHRTIDVDQKVDYGIQAGLSYEFRMNRQLSLQVQGRYYFGLGDIFPNAKGDYFQTSANQSVQIVMALWFHHRIKIKR